MLERLSNKKMFKNIVLSLMLILFFFSEYSLANENKFYNRTPNPQLQTNKNMELLAYRRRRYRRRRYRRKKKEEKKYIVSLDVTGNTALGREEILRNVATAIGEFVNEDKLKRDIKHIMDLGYFKDVKVEYNKQVNGYVLMFKVLENEMIPTINITGNTVFSKEEIVNMMKSKVGDISCLVLVRKDIKAIEDLYSDKGFVLARVVGIKTPVKKGEPLEVEIVEGVVEEVRLEGNDKTRDYVILREMEMKPGVVFNQNVLQKDLRYLYNLGYFAELMPSVLPGSESNKVVLSLSITEKSSGTINFGGGYSEINGFFGFTDLYLDNLFGTGQLIALRGQFGKSMSYQFKYRHPWALGRRRYMSLRRWYTTGSTSFVSGVMGGGGNINYRDETRNGGDISVGMPLGDRFLLESSFKAEGVIVPSANNNYYNIFSWSESISYDTRDFALNPSRGSYYTFSIEKAFGWGSEALDFTRVDMYFNKFYHIYGKHVLALRLVAGNKSGNLEDSELYYVGGSTTVRGFDDHEPFATGRKRLIFNAEWRYTFNSILQGVIFYDIGTATNDLFPLKMSDFRSGKGFGLRLTTPLGPIRLDYGINDHGQGVLHFNIGQAF